LHVLGTPPAFILSQDQTLMFKVDSYSRLLSLANVILNRPSRNFVSVGRVRFADVRKRPSSNLHSRIYLVFVLNFLKS
jgi:hypothetical protein